jgi:hypothetical protein
VHIGWAIYLLRLILDHLVMRGYLQMRQGIMQDSVPFWREIQEVEEVFQGLAPVVVHHLPAEHLRRLSGLLFDPVVPELGREGRMEVPFPLRQSALDAICRLADRMRVRRSELDLEAVIDRAGREIENLMQRLY